MEEKKIDKETLTKLRDAVGSLPRALSAEENLELLKKYRETNDIKFRNQLVCGNLRFAALYSSKHFQNLVSKLYSGRVDDLIQDLSLCLLYAAEKFDFSKGASFYTFVGAVIRGKFFATNKKSKSLKNRAEIVSFSSTASVSKEGYILTYEQTLEDKRFTEENFATNVDADHILKNIVPRLSEGERMIFNEFFIEEKSKAKIAKELNMSRMSALHTIGKIRNKVLDAYENGVETLKAEEKPATLEGLLRIQKVRNQAILRDYLRGELGLKEIAQKHNISLHNVAKIGSRFKAFCRENNINLPTRNWVYSVASREERNNQIWEEYLEGRKTQEEIAKDHSVSRATVCGVLADIKAQYLQRGEEVPSRKRRLKSRKILRSAKDTASLEGDTFSNDVRAIEQSVKEEMSAQAALINSENIDAKQQASSKFKNGKFKA